MLRTLLLLLCVLPTVPLTLPPNFITKSIPENFCAATRFPPEPNGFLHLGHAKSLFINLNVAQQFPQSSGPSWLLRMDDTNPAEESDEYVSSITRDVDWLTKTRNNPVTFTSDYFAQIAMCAEALIKQGRAYVDFSTTEQISEQRGTLTSVGTNSPYRPSDADPIEIATEIATSAKHFAKMLSGVYPDGHCVLRAKIDMKSPNMNLRDPVIYRLSQASPHHRTGTDHSAYPMYDFAHPIVDSLEDITHSICTLEFEDHRPFYDWVLSSLQTESSPSDPTVLSSHTTPQQIEFSRLALSHTILSKRKLLQLVTEKHVDAWDDPRMPTLAGVRRRGFTPASIELLCSRVGVSKVDSVVDYGLLENATREEMDKTAVRGFCVVDGMKLDIQNAGGVKEIEASRHPKDEAFGMRTLSFSSSVLIDKADFHDIGLDGSIPLPRKFKRLTADQGVRLRNAYVVDVKTVERDATGAVTNLVCEYDERTFNGVTVEGEKKAGIIHWVDEATSVEVEIRQYDRLFSKELPGAETGDFMADFNKNSRSVVNGRVETSVAEDCYKHLEKVAQSEPGSVYKADLHFQFERMGYYAMDEDSTAEKLVFNRVVTLRESWTVDEKKAKQSHNLPRRRGNNNI